MSANNSKPVANSANNGLNKSGSFLNTIGNVFSNAKSAIVGNNTNAPKTPNAPKNNNATRKNNNVLPASAGTPVVPVTTGGMAPVNFRYGASMQQPSEKVMEWATTAGAPMPPAAMMRNVAHGGKRRTKRRSSHKKRRTMRRKSTHRRRSCGGKHRRTMRHKSNKRRYNKRK
jgi:hypothetical protein